MREELALPSPRQSTQTQLTARFSQQVCSVLESLEQEYKREEDWCGGADKLGPNCETDHVTPMISKHLEQKEAFLKVTHTPTHTEYESESERSKALTHTSDLTVRVLRFN